MGDISGYRDFEVTFENGLEGAGTGRICDRVAVLGDSKADIWHGIHLWIFEVLEICSIVLERN